MSGVAATVFGIDEILSAFERKAPKPYFELYVKNQRVIHNFDNDFDKAKQIIIDQVEEFINSEFNQVFTIRMYNVQPKNKWTYEEKEQYLILYCQAKRQKAQSVGAVDANLYPIYNLIEKQNENIAALTSQVNAIKAEEEEEEQGVGSAEETLLNTINGIVNSPVVLMASPYLKRLMDRLIPEKKTIAGLAGTEPTDLETTINILFSKGVTLEHLQKLAAMPEEKIKMLIAML
jgi:hypothetical protein